MCTALVGAGDGWRFAATDLGLNVRDDGRVVEQRTTRNRLHRVGDTWLAGSGDGRLATDGLRKIHPDDDLSDLSEQVQSLGAFCSVLPHKPDQLENTAVMAATPAGVGYSRVSGEAQSVGTGGFFLITPPDVSQQTTQRLNRQLCHSLDMGDLSTVKPAVERLIDEVSQHSHLTASEFSIGVLERDGDTWAARRIDGGIT